MSLSPAVTRYKRVSALHLYDSADTSAAANSKLLEDVFKEYKFSVTVQDVGNKALKPGDRSHEVRNMVLKFLEKADPWEEELGYEPEKGETLVIFCYFGHGGVMSGKKDEHLFAGNEGEPQVEFDLTWIQERLRATCSGDVLCIMECCDGDFDGMFELDLKNSPGPDKGQHNESMIFEIAAAGLGIIEAPADGTAFSARLALHLKNDRTAVTVEDRVEAIKDQYAYAEGFYERCCGQQSIVLQPLKR